MAIPHHAGEAERESFRGGLGLGAEDTLLLFVGGLCARKDARFLIENHPAELGRVHLALVGPAIEAGYLSVLRAAVAASPAGGRIHIAGYMEDPSAAYRAADAFVFASHVEGCPNVLLEAMAYGLPAVARRLSGTTDHIVEHGRNGFLFDTAGEYAEAVRRLAGDPVERGAMGDAARATICARFEMEGIAGRYAELYRLRA